MSDLTAFLLARISEDEATARAAFSEPDPEYDDPIGPDTGWVGHDTIADDADLGDETAAHIVRFSPARILAECEKNRTILFLSEHGCGDDYERVHHALALPYSDHPDYRTDWA